MGKVTRLGIMGGTFDPIHYGHLVTAEAVRSKFNLDKVIFVPSGKPPHKRDQEITTQEHRVLMTVLATITNTYFDVSRVELERQGYSYAIDTVQHFRQIYGGQTEIFFITGADAILEILSWKKVDDLIDECQFVAATRPGYEQKDLAKLLPEKIINKIMKISVPALAISSTDIRRRVRENQPIKYLLPEQVEDYIFKHKIYVTAPY
ncbi:MAG: nicotinate-nucleotide adenylyltransferase [Clostridia bacterium]|nr:nicotinate-nucleotide adenylyltransferase [Clostridia bacterium]